VVLSKNILEKNPDKEWFDKTKNDSTKNGPTKYVTGEIYGELSDEMCFKEDLSDKKWSDEEIV
jgi:hypothetical protein